MYLTYIHTLNQNQRKSKHFPMLVNIFYITVKYAIHYKTDTGFFFYATKNFLCTEWSWSFQIIKLWWVPVQKNVMPTLGVHAC